MDQEIILWNLLCWSTKYLRNLKKKNPSSTYLAWGISILSLALVHQLSVLEYAAFLLPVNQLAVLVMLLHVHLLPMTVAICSCTSGHAQRSLARES